jgi:hypothetical protein
MGRTLGLSFFNDVLYRPVLYESGVKVGWVADLSAASMKG